MAKDRAGVAACLDRKESAVVAEREAPAWIQTVLSAVRMNSCERPAIVWVAFPTESQAIEGRLTTASQNCHRQFLK